MNIFRSALSACVLDGLDNVRNIINDARKQLVDEQREKQFRLNASNMNISMNPVGTLTAAVGTLTTTIDNIFAPNPSVTL